jgi:hypothetical protein
MTLTEEVGMMTPMLVAVLLLVILLGLAMGMLNGSQLDASSDDYLNSG